MATEKYIKETYKKLGDLNFASYWNLGYINALRDNKLINRKELEKLADYDNNIYLEEKKKIMLRNANGKK